MLLNISIGKRLTLVFLIPALIATLTFGSVEVQGQQRLLQESSFYQHLFNAYTSLTTGEGMLQQMHIDLQNTVAYAARPHPLAPILADDQQVIAGLSAQFDTLLTTYLQRDLIAHNAALVGLFSEAGHTAQIDEQQTYSETAQRSWQAYHAIQKQALDLVGAGMLRRAQEVLVTEELAAFSDAGRDLQVLIAFNETLLPSLHDAARVEVQKLLISIIFATVGMLLAIGLMGWLVSQTVVRRLHCFRAVVQEIEQGEFSARLAVDGRDEIALVSRAVNTTLDTIVGLLEETRQQRDELAKGEELKQLHEQLQREHEALNAANARLAALATTDPLTQLSNHRALQALLEQECERARRFGHPLSLLFFDGDRFKHVNDTYGHAVGDLVLCELARRARSVLRAGDTVGRFGGEEFLVILPETNEEEAKVVAERLRAAVVASPLASCEVAGGIAVTVSVGLASYPADGVTADELREQADRAMYWAKRLGRNQVRSAAEAVRANSNAAL